MSEPEYVDPNQLRPGPIRNESLPPELLDQIKAVFDVIGPYLGTTLEQFEISFMRDMHPESEVAVWRCITAAWLAYHERFLGDEALPNEDERKMLGALIAISMGVDDVAMLDVPVEVGAQADPVLRLTKLREEAMEYSEDEIKDAKRTQELVRKKLLEIMDLQADIDALLRDKSPTPFGPDRWKDARPEELQRLVLMTAIQFVLFEPVDWVEGNDNFKKVSDKMLKLIAGQCKWIEEKYR